MSEMVQLLVQAGAIGLCLVGLYLLWHFWRDARSEREKLHEECTEEREAIESEHRKERAYWNSENARMTAEMLKMAGLLMGERKKEPD